MAKFKGTAAANTIYGTALADLLDGGVGADTLIGGLGNDTYIFNDGADVLVEKSDGGIDTLVSSISINAEINISLAFIENFTVAGTAITNINGNSLGNKIVGNNNENELYGFTGNDTIFGGGGNDTLYANGSMSFPKAETNLIYGDGGDDFIYGSFGTNSLFGGDGADTLIAGYGNNVMAGGAGDDTYRLTIYNPNDPILPAIAKTLKNTFTINELATAGSGYDIVEIEANATVSTPFIYLLGANLEEVDASLTLDRSFQLTGNKENNSIEGGGMNDTLNGALGVDSLRGNAGDDTYMIDNTLDTVFEAFGEGEDTILFARTSVANGFTINMADFSNNVENFTLTTKVAYSVVGNARDNIITGNGANNTLFGETGNDQLIGGAGNDTLVGGIGNDYLDGGVGIDSFSGGDGDDTYVFDNARDGLYEADSGGIDTIIASTGVITGAFNALDLNIANHLAIENVTLTGKLNITVTGNNLGNSIFGNDGKNDIAGGSNNDFIDGGAGNDILTGRGGFDTLNGGLGNDTLIGGDTEDAFIFDTALSASNVDLIKFFNGDNKIFLDSAIFTKLAEYAGGGLPAFVGFATVTGSATEGPELNSYLVYNSTTSTLYYDADGAGGKASIAFTKFDEASDTLLFNNIEII